MQNHLLIGAGAGLVSAALLTSAAVSASLTVFLLYLCPLPLCLAGLGWGRRYVVLAGLVATVFLLVALGHKVALVYAFVVAIPIGVLVHLILQSRPIGPPGSEGSAAIEWYPVGRLVAAAALIAGTLAGLMVLTLGPDAASYQATIDEMVPLVQKALDPNDDVLTPDMVGKLKTILARALPFALAVVWPTITLFNLWLAGRIAKASGQALRPWPDLHGLEIPGVMVAGFAAALIASFLPGVIGLIGIGFSGALLFAYVLQGLAVIHAYTTGMQFRSVLLAGVYLGILFLGWLAILVAILGLGEPMFGLRARKSAAGSGKNNDQND